MALQPSLGHLYSQVNKQWNQGYKVKNSHSGGLVSDPMLSDVVVVSISGGFHDYQVCDLALCICLMWFVQVSLSSVFLFLMLYLISR